MTELSNNQGFSQKGESLSPKNLLNGNDAISLWFSPAMHLLDRTITNLGNGNAFFPSGNTPPVPVLLAFGGSRLHQCRAEGSWNLQQAIDDNPDALVRSFRELRIKEDIGQWEDLVFQFGPRAFLCANKRRIVAYAETHPEADALARQFTDRFKDGEHDATGAVFHLINQTSLEITTEAVKLPAKAVLDDDALDLHYPIGTMEWHHDLTNRLREAPYGLSIFEGIPGTGKTSYLRHLAWCLKESHRFYFIPPCNLHILKQPEFIGFWAQQRRLYFDKQFVVILEDCEGALMTRATDNRDQVSTILNLSDGMLADFLRIQIICTINCSVADLDPALLRPGRLLAHREFQMLEYGQALRLATHRGKILSAIRNYTLAEVFAGSGIAVGKSAEIGFAPTNKNWNNP